MPNYYSSRKFDGMTPEMVKDAVEKIRIHEELTGQKKKTFLDPKYLVDFLYVNIDNPNLDDEEFRQMVRNTLPLYRKKTEFERNVAKVKGALAQFRLDVKQKIT